MKRFTTILLLTIALLTALHPVVAFHYCSGNLASMEFFTQESSCCCYSDTDLNRLQENVIHEKDCCNTVSLDIATDDYLVVGKTVIPAFFSNCFICLLPNELPYLNFDMVEYSIIPRAPTEYILSTGREILSRICVYLI